MLILGAGGFAKELFEILFQKQMIDGIAFYDDVNSDAPDFLFDKYPVLKNEQEAIRFFQEFGNEFTLGIGNPKFREVLYQRFSAIGGRLVSTISSKANFGSFGVSLGEGCNILDGAIFSNYTSAGMGCLIYYNAVITHDSKLGMFVQVSPGVSILGGGLINDFTMIGANATILPKISVGKYAMIGAGSVVTRPVPDYALIKGNPAKQAGWVSKYGIKLTFDKNNSAICSFSGDQYIINESVVKVLNK